MIYADTSFLASLYGRDGNTDVAEKELADLAEPIFAVSPWQRFELANTIRLADWKLRQMRQPVRFLVGNSLKRIDQDFRAGFLVHCEVEWQTVLRQAEKFSDKYCRVLGTTASDTLHLSLAVHLECGTFLTFDVKQFRLAKHVGEFNYLPDLASRSGKGTPQS